MVFGHIFLSIPIIKKMKKTTILLGLLWCPFLHISAQKNRELSFDNFYFFAQVGAIKDYDLFVQAGVFVQYEKHYFRFSIADGTDGQSETQKQFHKSHRNCDCEVGVRGIHAINFEYGKVYKFFRRQQISLSSGFSMVTKTDPDVIFNQNKEPWEVEKFKKRITVGLPYELRYSLMINRGIGIGCSYYGNMNARKSFNAVSVGLALGLF